MYFYTIENGKQHRLATYVLHHVIFTLSEQRKYICWYGLPKMYIKTAYFKRASKTENPLHTFQYNVKHQHWRARIKNYRNCSWCLSSDTNLSPCESIASISTSARMISTLFVFANIKEDKKNLQISHRGLSSIITANFLDSPIFRNPPRISDP